MGRGGCIRFLFGSFCGCSWRLLAGIVKVRKIELVGGLLAMYIALLLIYVDDVS